MRRALLVGFALAGCGAIVVLGGSPAASQSSDDPGLSLITQSFAVTADGTAHFEFVVGTDVPEIVATTTSTTTSTTTTTTTSSTTTVPGQTDVTVGGPPTVTEPTTIAATATTTATTTTVPTPEMTVRVSAHAPVRSRSDVADVLAGSVGRTLDVVTFRLEDVSSVNEATLEGSITLDVPIADGGTLAAELALTEPGLYPITIDVLEDGKLRTSHTTFIEQVRTDGISRGPLTLAVLAAIDDVSPEPTNLELIEARPQLAEIAALGEAIDAPITAAIPPIYARTVLLDDSQLATRLADALAGEEIVAIPADRLDPSSAVGAGLTDHFVAEYNEGSRQLAATLPESRVRPDIWLAGATVTPAGASALSDLGTRLFVMTFDEYATLEGSIPTLTDTSLLLHADLVNGTTLPMVVIDPIMHLLDPDRDTGNTPAEDAVHLIAEISAMRQQLDPDRRGLVLTTPDLGVPDADVLVHLQQFANEHPDIGFESLADLIDLTNPFFVNGELFTVQLPDRPEFALGERARRLNATQLQVASVSSMLPAGDARPAAWKESLRLALSTGVTTESATLRFDAVDAELAAIQSQVEPPETYDFTLANRDSPVQIRIGNNGPTELTVVVHAEAEKLAFPNGDVTVQLAPNNVTEVLLDVTARANGVFPVFVQLRTPAGAALGEPVELTARVNTLTGLGRVITMGAVLALATWWFSYFRRRRRSNRATALDDARDRHPASE